VSPPTLLQIVPSLARGGLTRATLDTAQAIVTAGGSAIVASPGGAMVPDLLRLHAAHVEVPESSNPVWDRLTLPPKLAASLGKAEVDLIQAHSPGTAWIASALAKRLKIGWIATLHRPMRRGGGVARFVERRQSRASAVVAVSEYIARDARQSAPALADLLEVIPPGINIDRFNPAIVRADRLMRLASDLRIPDGAHVILCPALFAEDHGQKLLIDAVKKLGRDDVFCLLLGSLGDSAPFEKQLEQAIERSGLQGRVQIGPYVDDMPAAYMLADVVVATGGPRYGFSRTLIEAQAMGRPVVAEEGGGAAECVRPGVTGWLAAAGDADALAEALGEALSLSAEGRVELAQAAQEHVRNHYGLAQSNRRLLDLYERLTE
jgi:glycosyltransferase involved in cell wall biosynthesis